MMTIVRSLLDLSAGAVLLYFLILAAVYLVLMLISAWSVSSGVLSASAVEDEFVKNLPVLPPVSLIVPAYNEEKCIVDTVRSLLKLNYPATEIIVVDDGSTDGTLQELITTFDLQPVSLVYRSCVQAKVPTQMYWSSTPGQNLLVLHKVNGGKPDALNAGLNMARSPYFCTVDADTVVDPDGLRHLMAPIVRSKKPVIVSTGVVRTLNGSSVVDGKIDSRDLPNSWLGLCQTIEYMRNFLLGRPAWSELNATLICSGAFCLIDRNRAVEVGGFSGATVTEDTELIARMHRILPKPFSMAYTPATVCWTQAPHSLGDLGRQRRRWQLGLIQTVLLHHSGVFNPRCGAFGMISLPFHAFLEMAGAAVEFFGVALVLLAGIFGLISQECFFVFLAFSIAYGTLISMAAIFLHTFAPQPYFRVRDLCKLTLYAFLENFGYRQVVALFKCWAILQALTGTTTGWGKPARLRMSGPQDMRSTAA